MSLLERLFDAQLGIAGQQILWREILGNAFGFASAIGGLRRRVWAWPVGMIGNVRPVPPRSPLVGRPPQSDCST